MSSDFHGFAIETLVWTGVLILVVLVLRRPVTRHFGPHAAYALWALPFMRLLLPPLVLPAWLAPASPPAPQPAGDPGSPATFYTLAETGEAPVAVPQLMKATVSIDWLSISLAVWLAGAGVFVMLRFFHYFAMRRDLLASGVEVGRRGKVRLVETAGAHSPIAFGVIDKVVALPRGFMERTDPIARDLALEHELAHHRAHDLLVNIAVQPLFAIHWFNPLGWIGWRAMRCDQEAACDARVVAECGRELRGTYAAIIAAFATGTANPSRVALAAPMACPVLGDKSIVHRLRSLTMKEISPRRRATARMLMIGALVALPLTATITQAEVTAPPAAPVPPAPAASPTSLAAVPAAPAAPAAPGAPPAPEAPAAPHLFVTTPGADGEKARTIVVERKVTRDGKGEPREERSFRINGREATAAERAKLEAQIEGLRDFSRESEEIRKEIAVLRERFGVDGEFAREMEVLLEDLPRTVENAQKIQIHATRTRASMPRVIEKCDGSGETVRERAGPNGEKTIVICRTAALSSAQAAIKSARGAVKRDRDLSESERAEALRALDEALAEIRRDL